MKLIDTHAHICFDSYDEDRETIMQRAFAAGVIKIIHPCCRLEEFGTLETLTQEYNGNEKVDLYMAVGVHPTEINTWDKDSNELMKDLLKRSKELGSKIRAVGETGLDYYHCAEINDQKKQREVFQMQINHAKNFQLPLIVHTRDAWSDTLKILQDNFETSQEDRGTVHCFTGDLWFAEEVMKLGFCISWGGVLTYKKNDNFRNFAGKLDINKVLLETDCPFLAPQLNRGKRNEPSFMREVAEVLAACYKIEPEELAKITTRNAERLFRI